MFLASSLLASGFYDLPAKMTKEDYLEVICGKRVQLAATFDVQPLLHSFDEEGPKKNSKEKKGGRERGDGGEREGSM